MKKIDIITITNVNAVGMKLASEYIYSVFKNKDVLWVSPNSTLKLYKTFHQY